MAGNPSGGALNFLGNALIPETMARMRGEDAASIAERQAQAGNIAMRALMGGAGAPGTPATKSFQVNGRTIGQDRPAESASMSQPTQLGLLSKFAPGVVQSALAQQAISQIFPQGFTGTLGENQVAYQNGKQVAVGPTKTTDNRPEFLRVLDAFAGMDTNDPRRATVRDYLEKQTTRDGGRETWSNPVAEIGPDGKPIQVRYGSLGGRKVETGATPARQGNAFDRQDYWRGQFKPLLDASTDAGIQASKVDKSLSLDTGTGHIAAINALQKMIDQGAVVRDQDVALIQSAQSYLDQRKNDIERLKTGKLLGADLQKEMRDLAKQLETAIYEGTVARINPYQNVMTREGVDMRDVLPDSLYSRFAPSGPQQTQGQPVARVGQTITINGGTATRIK